VSVGERKIVRGKWVVAGGHASDEVLHDGAVVVEGDRIGEVGDWRSLHARYPDAETIGSDAVAVMPGLINAHHHAHGASSAQHGITDALLEPWILAHHAARASDPRLDASLSAARQLRTGVTTAVEVHSGGGDAASYARSLDEALAGYDASGIRVAFAAGVRTQSFLISGAGEDERFLASLPEEERALARSLLPAPGRIDEEDFFAIMEDARRAHRAHPRIDLWFAPPGPQWISDGFMVRMAERARSWDTGVQTHVDESIYEMLHGPRFYARHTMLHLHELGVLGPRFSIAHGVWLTRDEIAVMAQTGAALSHNPSSNLRLRAGIAPLNALLEADVTVGLGMDGTTLDDDEDMFTEMRLAMRLHRTPTLDGPAPEPHRVLELATVGGARVLRREHELGRIAPGCKADLVVVDLERLTWPWIAPETDPRELVLMRAKAGDVDTVLVDGEVVLRGGLPTRIDLEEAGRALAERLRATPLPAEQAEAVRRLTPRLERWYLDWEVPALKPWSVYNTQE